MKKEILIPLIALALLSIACGLSGGDKAETKAEQPAAASASEVSSSASVHKPSSGSEAETTLSEPEEPAGEAPASSKPSSNAPEFFRDDFDGELNTSEWDTFYHFFVDEDVEEDDEEAVPVYKIEQKRGFLRFDLQSPYLYLYHLYTPHTYEDVRIDIEIENKAVNTNNVSLVCRYTDYGWYEFIATSGGYYSIMRYYEDGNKQLAKGGIKSIKFGREKKNVFTAICRGKTLVYMVNGVEIAKVKDEEIVDAGYAGMNISSERATPVQVEVNWLEISQP